MRRRRRQPRAPGSSADGSRPPRFSSVVNKATVLQLLLAAGIAFLTGGCDPYPSGRGLDAIHPSSIRPRAEPLPLPPLGPEIRQLQESVRVQYQAKINALYPALKSGFAVTLTPTRGTQVFGLYAVHPAFADPAISSGSIGLEINAWIATNQEALIAARIREVGLAPAAEATGGGGGRGAFTLFVR